MFHRLRAAPALLLASVALLASSCTMGPKYKRPAAPPPPAAYKEAPPESFKKAGAWKPAEPNDAAARGRWWEIFGDTHLNALEAQVNVSNQNIQQVEAEYRAARAAVRITRASLSPSVVGNGTVTGSRSSANRGAVTPIKPGPASVADLNLAVDFVYEADVWGKIRSALQANVASAQATAADLETLRLSIHALVATDYFELRGLDTQRNLLESTAAAYQKALDLTTNRYKQGIVARLDVVQAQTLLETTRTQIIDTQVQRAQFEHAIAVLLGKAPADLTITPEPHTVKPPPIPVALPGALLERRPDIAAAERRVAAANAQIGVAKAAFYPTISFSAAAGLEGNSLLNWFTWPSRFWSVGPALAQTLFDAGGRKAATEQVIASYDATAAAYRQTVLGAFQDVEDNLAALRILEREQAQQKLAVDSAALATEISLNQYKGGITTYLSVITAQALELSNRRSEVDILTRRIVASVLLIKALGGGWEASQLPPAREFLPAKRTLHITTQPGTEEIEEQKPAKQK